MRWWCVFALVAMVTAGTVRADVTTLYTGTLFDVEMVDPDEFTSPSFGPLVYFTLRIVGHGGYQPSSFDGVQRGGVMNGATGITGPELFYQEEPPIAFESRFLNPADLLVIDPALLPGYVPDPAALTGLFAISNPAAVSPTWDLAEIITDRGASVRLDFTIGDVNSDELESVDFTFITPNTPPVGVPGDCDGDGDVDLDDFVILKGNFGMGSGANQSDGDFDGDGDVDLDDFVALKNNFGTAAVVPEPVAPQ